MGLGFLKSRLIILLIICLCIYAALSWWSWRMDSVKAELTVKVDSLTKQHSRKKETLENPAKENLYLSSIVFVDADHWTIWLNDRRFRADEEFPIEGFKLVAVSGDGIQFMHKGSTIELTPQHTYQASTGTVLKGDRRRSKMRSD